LIRHPREPARSERQVGVHAVVHPVFDAKVAGSSNVLLMALMFCVDWSSM
jgi:hypothetical protein